MPLLFCRETFTPLVEKCKSLNRAIRIGTNHGSLSARILSYYGGFVQYSPHTCACVSKFWMKLHIQRKKIFKPGGWRVSWLLNCEEGIAKGTLLRLCTPGA